MNALLSLLRNLFRRKQVERELEEELQGSLELLAQEKIAAGMPENAAWRAARIELGGLEQVREAVRDVRRGAALEQFWQDLKFAARQLRKSPGFTLIAVLVLSVGLGVSAAMFGLYDLLLRNPYRFKDADRLVDVQAIHSSGRNSATGYADYLDWRDQSSSFEEMAIEPWVASVTVTGAGEPRRATLCRATASFFPLLGVQPALGRVFTADEDQRGAPRVLLLSGGAWRDEFGMDHAVTGRSIVIDDVPHAVIGVMPDHFRFPGMPGCAYWTPLRESGAAGRYQHQYGVWAKLKPRISLERAQADMSAIAASLERAYPATNKGWGVVVRPLREVLAENAGTLLSILGAAVAFVLLLACVNVAGLMMARGSARTGEMAIRASLGAGRLRLVRQALTESFLLGALGGAAGIGVAKLSMRLFVAAAPPSAGLEGLLEMNLAVVTFTVCAAIAASLLFGIIPALHGSRVDWNARLKGGATGAMSRNRWLAGLVVAETALSLVLLAGVGLLAQGLYRALTLELGLRAENTLTFGLDLPARRYPEAQAAQFFASLLDKLRQAPGMVAAGAVGTLPMTSGYSGTGFEVEGRDAPADWMELTTQLNEATPDYFRAMGIAILRGRPFGSADTERSTPVVAIDETFAHRYFAGEDPVGRRIRFRGGAWQTIVAVVGAVRHQTPANAPVPQLYRPHAQAGGVSWVVLRAAGDAETLAGFARRAVAEIDPGLPVLRMRTMGQVVNDSLVSQRIMTSAGLFSAGFALLLSAMGIFGVVAYSVARRRHELGIRMALGATRGDVLATLMRQGARLSLAGTIAGLPVAVAAGRVLSSRLTWVAPANAVALAAAAAILLCIALAASFLPARRAARIDPMESLRQE